MCVCGVTGGEQGVVIQGKDFTAVGKLLSKNIKGYCGTVVGYLLVTCAPLLQHIQISDKQLPIQGHISSPPFM